MIRIRQALLLTPLCVLAWWVSSVSAGPGSSAEPESVDPKSGQWQQMARRVDSLLDERWQREGVQPAPLADDSEFLRRVHLDLTGSIPSVAQVREFLADTRTEKREELIERILSSPAHITHLANTWRNIMLPSNFSAEQLSSAVGLHGWLRRQFSVNLRYDRLVSDLVAATSGESDGPALFFTALDLEPKKLAASTSRIFLGLQLECAECHDHPFDRWTQEDFWAYTAFFARLPNSASRGAGFRLVDSDRGDVTLPDTEQVVLPKFPGGRSAPDPGIGSRRQQLSIWLASPENPYVARAAVNRVWALLFGRGLVHPVDDLGPNNPASHPELLEELSAYFVDTHYDLKNLLRTLANTEAYQRSSQAPAEGTPPRPELFTSMAVKVLTAEQLYDSLSRCLSTAGGNGEEASPVNRGYDGRRQAFIARMQSQSRDATEYNGGLQQALNLMNGGEVSEATDLGRSALLTSLEAPFFSDQSRIEILFLATLSRFPSEAESAGFQDYLARSEELYHQQAEGLRGPVSGGAATDEGVDPPAPETGLLPEMATTQLALSDILWALLNSSEFALNH